MRGQRLRERLAHGVHPRLARPVGGGLGLAPERAARRDVDDAPAPPPHHVPRRAPGGVGGAQQVRLEGPAPAGLPLGVGHLGDRMGLVDARVVDQHVEPAQLGRDRADHARDGARVADVGLDDEVRPPRQPGPRPLRRRPVPVAVDGDPRPPGRELPGDGAADALRRPRHEHRLAGEVHAVPLLSAAPGTVVSIGLPTAPGGARVLRPCAPDTRQGDSRHRPDEAPPRTDGTCRLNCGRSPTAANRKRSRLDSSAEVPAARDV